MKSHVHFKIWFPMKTKEKKVHTQISFKVQNKLKQK